MRTQRNLCPVLALPGVVLDMPPRSCDSVANAEIGNECLLCFWLFTMAEIVHVGGHRY